MSKTLLAEAGAALMNWLASGQRGVSSNTMVSFLTGIDALGTFPPSHPWDPDDLGRCRKLLERVPHLLPCLPDMADCSPEWAALVVRWHELCALMDSEAPRWRDGCGRAPKTYKRMRQLIDGAAGSGGRG